MLQHETWPIDKLIEYARNPRKNDHAVDRVAAAIREFGFRVPVVAKSDGTVVDGHLRLKAAKKLGLTEVPVVLADDMTDLQIKAFRLSVNKMAELAEWDDELLAIELHELNAADFDAYLLFGIHGEGGLSAIGENDDAAEEGTNASIAMTLPSDALYEVWATSFAPSEAGSYSLTLTDLGPEPEPGSLLVGATLRGALSGQDPVGADGTYFDGYRFEAAAGQAIRITATSNAFDAYLQLGRMDGRVFTVEHEDDDGLSDLNSLITFTPDEAGAYVVRVRSYSPGETGDYVLTVEDAPAE